MNMQMISFLYRPMTSIHLSYDITGSITKCHIDSLVLKLVLLMVSQCFFCHFNVFIKIHEYVNWVTCITYHRLKALRLKLLNETTFNGLG